MSSVVRTGGRMAVLVIALTLANSGSLMALDNSMVSYPKRTENSVVVFQDTLTATVTFNSSTSKYHYLYDLDFQQGYNGANLTEFSVNNDHNYEFSAAGNNKNFTNPQWGITSSNSVWWKSGTVAVGNLVQFWFDSYNPCTDVKVTIKASRLSDTMDSLNPARTLGMAAPVPEPGTLVSLFASVMGLGAIALKRRSTR